MEIENEMKASETIQENEEALERIKNLLCETNKMKEAENQKKSSIQNYFKQLRDKINNSNHFLTKIKHDIENIKFALQEDRSKSHDLNNAHYLELCNKTDEEIDAEFKKVHYRMDELQKRVSCSKDKLVKDDKTFKETLSETVQALDNVSKGMPILKK